MKGPYQILIGPVNLIILSDTKVFTIFYTMTSSPVQQQMALVLRRILNLDKEHTITSLSKVTFQFRLFLYTV